MTTPQDGTARSAGPVDPMTADLGPQATPEQDALARSMLSALPVEPMPDQVWARLAGALAAEGTREAEVVPLAPRRRPGRLLTALAGAAAAVVAVAVGVQVVGGRSGPVVSADGAAATTAGPVQAPVAATPVVASGTTYAQASLDQQVGGLVTANLPAPPSAPSGAAPTDGSPALAAATRPAAPSDTAGSFTETPARITGCITALTAGRGAAFVTLVIDLASYEGRPAAVVVLRPSAVAGAPVDVWVVGRGCAPGDPQQLTYREIVLP